MAQKVYKYELERGWNNIKLPPKYTVLSAKTQYNKPFLYVLVDTMSETERDQEVIFLAAMTGEKLPKDVDDYKFIDTVLLDDGAFVFHVFEDKIV